MHQQQATIKNHQGIHCRPSAVIMKAIEGFDGQICLESEKGDCDSITILGLMSLGLECGETVTITVHGEGAEQMCEKLARLFENEFDFPPSEEPCPPTNVAD